MLKREGRKWPETKAQESADTAEPSVTAIGPLSLSRRLISDNRKVATFEALCTDTRQPPNRPGPAEQGLHHLSPSLHPIHPTSLACKMGITEKIEEIQKEVRAATLCCTLPSRQLTHPSKQMSRLVSPRFAHSLAARG